MFSSSFGRIAASNLARGASDAKAHARKVETDSTFMKMELERLFMITEALWTFMRNKPGYNDADLELMIQNIDLKDGKLDGMVAKEPAQKCGRCNRALLRAKPFCIYCGEPVTGQTFTR